MAMRPTLEWPVEEGALYTVMMLDTGIERLEGLQYIHWMVENIPGNEVICLFDCTAIIPFP